MYQPDATTRAIAALISSRSSTCGALRSRNGIKSALRREERAKDADVWYRSLDMENKDGKMITAKSVWSNELAAIPEFDKTCAIRALRKTQHDSTDLVSFVKLDSGKRAATSEYRAVTPSPPSPS